MWEIVLDHLPSIAFLLVSSAILWGVRKLSLRKDVEEAIISLTKRVVDKCEEMVGTAMEFDSEGGARITAAEFSLLRQKVWDLLLTELKGPSGSILRKWGEARVKGLIGIVLAKMGVSSLVSE